MRVITEFNNSYGDIGLILLIIFVKNMYSNIEII